MSRSNLFARQLLEWFDRHGRKNLPWQDNRSAYRVWLSEVMLQQTQVSTVIPYFERFVTRFPTVSALAAAASDEVMKHWAGLGYYARARNLHACARQVCQQYGGEFPQDVELLQQLPGIGRSTAGAIVAQAYQRRAVILDGNVKRVLTRYRMVAGWPGKAAVQRQLWTLADSLTPQDRIADYTQAIMDLGATICRRSKPLCDQCPLLADCYAVQQDAVAQFPEKKQRVPLPTREVRVLLCYQADKPQQILLEKRPPSGIWGGLWSLPQCEPVQIPEDVIAAQYGYKVRVIKEDEPVIHSLTHLHMCIRPLRVELGNATIGVAESSVNWCDADKVSGYGMPKPIETLVSQFFKTPD